MAASAGLPFAVSGWILSRLFRLYTQMTGSLYAADLAGAAAGALFVPVLLPALGPAQSILALATILAAVGAAGMVGHRWGAKTLIASATAIVAVGILYLNSGNALFGETPIGKDPDKDLYRLTTLQGGSTEIVDSRWSTFGRTDLVRFDNDSTMMTLFIDGAAGTNMLRFNGDLADSSRTFMQATQDFGGMIPLLNLRDDQKDNALIIGPGGGRDVLLTLKAGFKKITAVDINPQMVEIVKDYRKFNGGIYTGYKNVKVVVAEGRNYLRHIDEKYDVIMLFMPITKSSRSLNAFALSESYLFTKEAFADYQRHLTDEGSLLIMGHDMPEAPKLTTTALATMLDEGMTVRQAMNHLYILGSHMMPLFGMRKTALQPSESDFLHSAAHYTMFDCRYSYIPGVEQQLLPPPLSSSIDAGVPMMNPLFIAVAEGKVPLERFERGVGFNLVPANDDRPFFSQYGFSVPAVVVTVLWVALAVLAAVLFIPGLRFRFRMSRFSGSSTSSSKSDDHTAGEAGQNPFSWWLPIFFIAIGMGYIVIELALFQKLIFYLGDPSRSLALLLASLLAGSGVGSLISRNSKGRGAMLGGLFSAVAAMCVLIFMPAVFSALHDSSLPMQQIVAAVALFLQGLPMGLMFPIGLRVAEMRLGKPAVPWMWAINGSASVVGSALAIVIAMSAGYSWSLIFGGACYGIAALSMQVCAQGTRASLNTNSLGG